MRWHSSGGCRIQKNNDDILHDGSKGGREMGTSPGLQLPSLFSVCKVKNAVEVTRENSNRLSREMVDASSLETFKVRLNWALSHLI